MTKFVLIRAHMRETHRRLRLAEEEEDEQWELEQMQSTFLKATVDEERRERCRVKKRRRTGEKRMDDIPLLEFIRQVVDLTMKKHAAERNKVITSQKEASALLTPGTLAQVRYDSGRHLVRMTATKGVCRECKKRSNFRCTRCDVALHPDECFYNFHVPVEEREVPV